MTKRIVALSGGKDSTALALRLMEVEPADYEFCITPTQVKEYLRHRGVEVPDRTDCDFCFFQRLAEWWRLWRYYLDRYMESEALEILYGHTFRSAQRDSWPASLKDLRLMFEKGYVPKGAAQINLHLDVSERSTMCAWCSR